MNLPSPDELVVEREKIVDYLLNSAHPYGASRARFFGEFGFRLEDWETLAQALREHGRHNEVTRATETGFGPRYGEIRAPDGRRLGVITVWQFDRAQIAPRLTTAYPLKKRL